MATMMSPTVMIVVYVPETHADAVRTAMGAAGAGVIGNYTYCSFSQKGVGRYLPGAGADPHIGEVGTLEQVAEERIEMVCARIKLETVIRAMKQAHPYEEVAFNVTALEPVP